MNKLMFAFVAVCGAMPVLAGLYGDIPDSKHAWAVHDWNRPKPAKVTPASIPGNPPSDAVVLFDGTKECFERNWCDNKGRKSLWKLGDDGDFYCVPDWKNGGDIYTRKAFGDCQLHLEYRHDVNMRTDQGPQMRGNSGVFLMGNYEIQVLDSYHTSQEDCSVDNYTDGQAGSVYAENPPMVNPQRPVGQWQTYDIIFHQPVWKDGKLLHPGSVTVFFNGVLVQDHWEMEGLTTHCRRRPLAEHAKALPLHLQDHGCTVHFRNIWYRPIPSRWDNLTHCEMSADPAEVMKLRNKTADELLAKIDLGKNDASTVNKVLEVASYSTEGARLEKIQKVCTAYGARLAAMDDAALEKEKGAIMSVKKSYDVLQRGGVAKECKLSAQINAIIEKKGWNKK